MLDLSSLNQEQKEAVLDFDHNLLILACAGSGKTRTITSKIAYAIESGLYRPHEICAVTFTNRAAKEMRDRVASLLPDLDISKMEIRTFHSLGAYLLRRFGSAVGLDDNFCIYDDEDSLSLLTSVSKREKKDLRNIQKAISKAKDLGLSPDSNGLDDISRDYDFRTIFKSYQEALKKTGNVDFADLIGKTAELLHDPESEASLYCHSRFKLILVDEYQDSNREQFVLLKLFAGDKSRLVVVGDDDQSIYSFRGADVSNILTFDKMFDNVREIKLEKNYRSTDEILKPAAALIRNNKNRHIKDIVSADSKSGAKPSVLCSPSGTAEAMRIAQLISNVGDYDNTAILYRTNAQSQVFEQQLKAFKIPYKLVGALSFYDREEVKDALAFMYLLMNRRDSVSFKRIINKPRRGIGDQKIEQILSFNDDIQLALEEFVSKGKGSAVATATNAFLGAWKNADEALSKETNLGDLLYSALEDTKLLDYYNSEEDSAVRKTRIGNLGELVSVLHEAGSGKEALALFLEKLTLDSTTLGDKDPLDEKGVTLITMHNTKGLEYDRVFCAGLEEGLIPGISSLDNPREKEEERRILYVAMTRARKSLYLSFAKQRLIWGRTNYQSPSEFLKEIPSELLSGEVSSLESRGSANKMYQGSFYSGYRATGYSDSEKARTTVTNTPSWALGIDYPKQKPKTTIKKNTVSFSVGDKVKSASYGEGEIVDIESRPDKRILTIVFGARKVRFVEASAMIEKI